MKAITTEPIIGTSDDVQPPLALAPVNSPVAMGEELATDAASLKITKNELTTRVASIIAEYSELDPNINDLTNELLAEHRKLTGRIDNELMPSLNRMQMLLSQRGELHALLATDPSLAGELDQLGNLPTWTEWFEMFRSRFDVAMTLRTVQRKLKLLRGETNSADDDGEFDDSPESDTDEPEAPPTAKEREEVRTASELLAEHVKCLKDALTGKSINNDAMRISRAVGLVKDLEIALDEGVLFDSPPVSLPTAPSITGMPVSDPDTGMLESLRRELFRIADTWEAERILMSFLEELAKPLLAEHPNQPTLRVEVHLSRPEEPRVSVGDWVVYKGGDQRLRKQIGQDSALGRVVGVDKLNRPRIRWNDGSEWKKPYSLFDETLIRVVFDYQAATTFPDAYSSYPVKDIDPLDQKKLGTECAAVSLSVLKEAV